MYKILFIMRVIALLFFAAVMQVSASTHAQKLTYVQKNASLEQLFKEIKKQTGYNIVWYEGKLNPEWSVNANFRKTPLKDVMNIALTGMQLDFTISNKTVVIKEKEMSLMDKLNAAFSNILVHGRVVDETGSALQGASVKVKNTNKVTITDVDGHFTLNGVPEKAMLVISYLGFETKEVEASEKIGTIQLISGAGKLNEVEVVSTGYQDIPKERATGSFTVVDNKLFNRAVSPDVLSRLKGVTNGLLFENGGLLVRGKATIFSNTQPLIVVDNFPFEGNLNTLNPNDIENVTLLKDAAAASIWGARAGNGVIVITTKKGKLNQMPSVDLNMNITIGGKPDLYYQPQLSSDEFIGIEEFLFDKGAYTATIANKYGVISPVVYLLNKAKTDPSYAAEARKQIDALRNIDVRDQQLKYFYRQSTRQQYHVDLRGGGQQQSYYFSGGYDKNLPNSVTNSDSRITLKGNNIYYLLDNKLMFSTDIAFSKTMTKTVTNGYNPFLPYEKIVDENGVALPTLRNGGLREEYTDTAGKGDLLDWKYRPLEELRRGYSQGTSNLTDYRLNLKVNYKIIPELILSLNYQYYKANREDSKIDGKESFYTRDRINKYSQINSTTRTVTRPVPLGDIYTPSNGNIQFNYGRVQLNYNKLLNGKHEISAIFGSEIRDESSNRLTTTLYGYNPETALSTPVDLINQYKLYYNSTPTSIDGQPFQAGTVDRYFSFYGNLSYTYLGKYILSGSYRKDESNLFGVRTNQKGVPLWSTGVAWSIDKESFFNVNWLSTLQIKATYGYNGNVNKSVSAYLTAKAPVSAVVNQYRSSYYEIINPPNDDLKWERVQNINLGLYFATRNNRINGSIEFFTKNGLDLIASSPIAPQTGITSFTGNTANTKTKGIDIQVNSTNLNGIIGWNTVSIFNYAKDKVTDYKVTPGSNSLLVNGVSLSPIVDYPINSVFAYKWAGLDAQGNPLGYLNGAVSSDYTKINSSTNRDELVFFGSRTPTFFGSLRNIIYYKTFELSFNLTYKFGYYFQAPSLNYGSLFTGSYQQRDYDLRWKNPGDELITNVPSMVYPNVGARTGFYNYSSIQIEKGDHIRLQDIQVNYNLSRKKSKNIPFSDLNIYCYATNLGVIWRNNDKKIDPDNLTSYPEPKTISFGIRTNL